MEYAIKKMNPQLLVANIVRSIEFYINTLGFDVDFRYQDFYAGIIKNGCSIHLKMTEHSIKDNRRSKEDIHITFLIDSIEDLYNDFLNKFVELTQSLRDMPYGKEFYVADPDNNIVAFLEYA